jgi:hypothetical protein
MMHGGSWRTRSEQSRNRQAEITLRRQMAKQQKEMVDLATIEQEKNRIRIEMYEAARQAELRKLQLEQERRTKGRESSMKRGGSS